MLKQYIQTSTLYWCALVLSATSNAGAQPFDSTPIFKADENGRLAGVQKGDQLTVKQVHDALADSNWVVVDTRSPDAFNGWAMEGIKRGGHIPGSVDFAARWLKLDLKDRRQQLKNVLLSKGVDPADHIVLYSVRESDRQSVAGFLKELGYQNIYYFDLKLWIDSGYQLEKYPQHHRLLPPLIVKQLIDGKLPRTFEKAKNVKLVEVSWGDEAASYSKGHIPCSFHVNTDHFEPPPKWYLGDRDVLSRFAQDYGFQKQDTVIISGEDVMASYRLCVVLLYMGVDDVRVLNGGLAAWKLAGYPVETDAHLPKKTGAFGALIPQRPELIISTKQVKSHLRDAENFSLVDTRTWAEYVGKESGYTYHPHKGRVPGAIYGQGDFRGPDSMTPYRNPDQTMRNFKEILGVWKQSGIKPENHLSFMCGGGWRAAEVLMFARVAGRKNTSLYSDGWIGWSNDQQNPIETGPGPVKEESKR